MFAAGGREEQVRSKVSGDERRVKEPEKGGGESQRSTVPKVGRELKPKEPTVGKAKPGTTIY
jgi:hypothetical protein